MGLERTHKMYWKELKIEPKVNKKMLWWKERIRNWQTSDFPEEWSATMKDPKNQMESLILEHTELFMMFLNVMGPKLHS